MQQVYSPSNPQDLPKVYQVDQNNPITPYCYPGEKMIITFFGNGSGTLKVKVGDDAERQISLGSKIEIVSTQKNVQGYNIIYGDGTTSYSAEGFGCYVHITYASAAAITVLVERINISMGY